MSFINENVSKGYEPGYFLAHEECTRVTKTMSKNGAYVQTAPNGGKYVPMGTIFPANGSSAIGIVYEDVDVTSGDMPGSVVIAGQVYEANLPVAPQSAAKTAMVNIKFLTKPSAVTRPY